MGNLGGEFWGSLEEVGCSRGGLGDPGVIREGS